jgi:hypothetical protein
VSVVIARGPWECGGRVVLIVSAVIAGCASSQTGRSQAHLSCHHEVTEQALSPPAEIRPGSGDLVVGPLSFPDGRRFARMRPRDVQPTGRLTGWYKIPPVLAPGATVTVAIAPHARSRVVLITPGTSRGVAAATFHGCSHAWGFFPGGFQFTDARVRGCIPMDVTVRGQSPRRVVLSLFAGDCSTG